MLLVQRPNPNEMFLDAGLPASPRSRLKGYVDWLNSEGLHWAKADLSDYRDYLIDTKELNPVSVKSILSTIRSRYQKLLVSNEVRDQFYALVDPDLSFVEKQALINELYVRLNNSINPRSMGKLDLINKKDEDESEFLRLTPAEFTSLIQQPGITTLRGLRNTAIFALTGCTGIRQAELRALKVEDLRARLGRELSLIVKDGKRGSQRLIPYGPLIWCLDYVEVWLEKAKIQEGYVFRGIGRHGQILTEKLSQVGLNKMFRSYPILIGDKVTAVKPHDLRRTYARLAWEAGMDLLKLQQNLGHDSQATTSHYIGALGAESRRPPEFIKSPFDLQQLRSFTAGILDDSIHTTEDEE